MPLIKRRGEANGARVIIHSPLKGGIQPSREVQPALEILITLSLSSPSLQSHFFKKLSPGGFHAEKLTAWRTFKLKHLCHHSVTKYLKPPRTTLILQCSSFVGKLCL